MPAAVEMHISYENMKTRVFFLLAALWAAAGSAAELNVMTFNMRYDNPKDGENNWKFRRERVARVVVSNGIDVVGAQELLVNQFDDMKRLLPDYAAVGVGRGDGAEKGEFSAVFYRRDRFELLDSGTFWLSETPEKAGSKGWDGACERIATWAVLRPRHGGGEFLFINTHLDHVGEKARREGVRLLTERIGMLRGGRPVILTGDFNADPASSVIGHVLRGGVLRHVRDIAAETRGTSWSFSGFGRVPEAERLLIDYIFVSDGFEALRYEVLPDKFGGGYVSDHAPVMSTLEFKER